ncbi:MAG: hypothetical protein KAR01_05770, partial [Desulfocapsa sp.]|nr:hypothetical protein [Desulfocapsa sp.]
RKKLRRKRIKNQRKEKSNSFCCFDDGLGTFVSGLFSFEGTYTDDSIRGSGIHRQTSSLHFLLAD